MEKETRTGIEKLAQQYSFSDEVVEKLNSYVDTVCMHLHVKLLCSWDPDKLNALYDYGDRQQLDVDEEVNLDGDEGNESDPEANPKGMTVIVDKFYVIRPPPDNDFGKCPYTVGLIKGLTTLLHTDGVRYPAAFIQYWELKNNAEQYKGAHTAKVVLSDKVTFANLDVEFVTAIEEELEDMYTYAEFHQKPSAYIVKTKRGARSHQTKGLWHTKKNIETLKFWYAVHSDKSGDLGQLSDDEANDIAL